MRYAVRHLERLADANRPGRVAINRQFGFALDDITGFDAGMRVSCDNRVRLDFNRDDQSFVARRRPVRALQDGAFDRRRRRLGRSRRNGEAGDRTELRKL